MVEVGGRSGAVIRPLRSELVFIDDDRDRMAARVVRLQGRHAHR